MIIEDVERHYVNVQGFNLGDSIYFWKYIHFKRLFRDLPAAMLLEDVLLMMISR